MAEQQLKELQAHKAIVEDVHLGVPINVYTLTSINSLQRDQTMEESVRRFKIVIRMLVVLIVISITGAIL